MVVVVGKRLNSSHNPEEAAPADETTLSDTVKCQIIRYNNYTIEQVPAKLNAKARRCKESQLQLRALPAKTTYFQPHLRRGVVISSCIATRHDGRNRIDSKILLDLSNAPYHMTSPLAFPFVPIKPIDPAISARTLLFPACVAAHYYRLPSTHRFASLPRLASRLAYSEILLSSDLGIVESRALLLHGCRPTRFCHPSGR